MSAPLEPANSAPLMPHDRDDANDGILEHDNPAPRWLTLTFLGCIAFAAIYFTYFHIAHRAATPQESFQVAWADYQAETKAARATEVVAVSEALLDQAAHDPDTVAHGHQVFVERCTGCHTDNGRGLVGPNLTDDFQIHGHTRLDIFTTVTQGVVDKGMVAWGEQLAQHDIIAVAAFASTLRGTNVPGGKAPQGERVGSFTP
jgi:cytochrome c oxidase cbb3-type subunit III